ncbi:LytTR family DNA-binding domain-containing protein [Facklamia sp. 7083-14-GEN3]|uniref:LytR/AlgR family response regulator transcription factor n=1 Tax=Facklamia sp. 7083-14-GEN3 TaxID=2973478 RepID=UPI00215C0CE6|nr:DNA-binding response regulator [Facklamia sp. 7083-14-GEN3]MCR8969737.1 DNA-binding response regulator [Facklamia sp. 7083-14-GEN3]
MYPVIVCEDNPYHLEKIETILKYYLIMNEGHYSLELLAKTPNEVMTYIENSRPQDGIYLLDVDLKQSMNGIQLAQFIRERDVGARIIFITTHEEAAPETFRYNIEALGFIEKTGDIYKLRDEINDILDIAYQRQIDTKTNKDELFSFYFGSEKYNFNWYEILYIETTNSPHRLSLITLNGQYSFNGSINKIQDLYPRFLKISRSTLVNPDNVTKVDYKNRFVYFESHFPVTFSHRMKKVVKDYFKNY